MQCVRSRCHQLRDSTRNKSVGNYFFGWKRKWGLVTLVIAIALAIGWIRSLLTRDDSSFVTHGNWNMVILKNGYIAWCLAGEAKPGGARSRRFWTSFPHQGLNALYPIWRHVLESMGVDCGGQFYRYEFVYGTFGDEESKYGPVTVVIIPYWSIVMPLTFVSAGLLLVKARKPKNSISGNSTSHSSTTPV